MDSPAKKIGSFRPVMEDLSSDSKPLNRDPFLSKPSGPRSFQNSTKNVSSASSPITHTPIPDIPLTTPIVSSTTDIIRKRSFKKSSVRPDSIATKQEYSITSTTTTPTTSATTINDVNRSISSSVSPFKDVSAISSAVLPNPSSATLHFESQFASPNRWEILTLDEDKGNNNLKNNDRDTNKNLNGNGLFISNEIISSSSSTVVDVGNDNFARSKGDRDRSSKTKRQRESHLSVS